MNRKKNLKKDMAKKMSDDLADIKRRKAEKMNEEYAEVIDHLKEVLSEFYNIPVKERRPGYYKSVPQFEKAIKQLSTEGKVIAEGEIHSVWLDCNKNLCFEFQTNGCLRIQEKDFPKPGKYKLIIKSNYK